MFLFFTMNEKSYRYRKMYRIKYSLGHHTLQVYINCFLHLLEMSALMLLFNGLFLDENSLPTKSKICKK